MLRCIAATDGSDVCIVASPVSALLESWLFDNLRPLSNIVERAWHSSNAEAKAMSAMMLEPWLFDNLRLLSNIVERAWHGSNAEA